MVFFIVNKAFFLHVHILNDGTIIEHAHPYDTSNDSSPYKSHHHSNAQLLFFHHLELLFLIFFLTLVLLIAVRRVKVSFKYTSQYRLIHLDLPQGRAPPQS